MVTKCPTCGAIHHPRIRLGPIQSAILDYITRHPNCTVNDIREAVYQGQPRSTNIIAAHLQQIRRYIAVRNVTIKNSGRGPRTTYRLEQLP